MKLRTDSIAAAMILALALIFGCNPDPGHTDQTRLYRPPGEEGPTSGERGSVMISEIHWAGSVTNDGTHDWDDVFVELQNKSERTVNLTDWRLEVRGDHSDTYRIPDSDPVPTNEYFVIAAKKNGAFGDVADVVIEDLELGRKHIDMTLLDADERLMSGAGSEERRLFAGSWDTVSARSMERVQLIFTNSGSASRSWHSYSSNTGFETIPKKYRKFTLASPGEANSTDYSGSTSSGSFE